MQYRLQQPLTGGFLLVMLFMTHTTMPHTSMARTLEPTHSYQVAIDEQLTTLSVRLCFSETPPQRLYNTSSQGHRYVTQAAVVHEKAQDQVQAKSPGKAQGKRSLKVTPYTMRLGNLKPGSCVQYQVDMARAAQQASINSAATVGKHLLTSANLWLWRSQDNSDIKRIVEFDLPAGLSVSTPWKLVAPNRYDLGQTPHSWPCQVAFGDFSVTPIAVQGGQLRLAILDGQPAVDTTVTRTWLLNAAQALSQLYGRLPDTAPQILVVPLGRGGEPMPYAQVTRGGGNAVHFYIDQRSSPQSFYRDWTASHELSHLLLPFVDREDAWLSEGLASYFQNVLMARNGTLSQRRAWEKLYEGFQRAVALNYPGTLAQATRRMYSENTRMRVYWSGAAMMMLADVQLRQNSQEKQSLVSVLEQLNRCCLPSQRLWSAWEVMDKLDTLANSAIFKSLYRQYVDSKQFPDYRRAFRDLGIGIVNDRVSLLNNARFSGLRDRIMETPLETRPN